MSEQEVRERAYALWENEGRLHGRDLVHWFHAETEIASPFPEDDFRAFAQAALGFFPAPLSEEVLADRSERLTHFNFSAQAVRFRYRLSIECCAELKALLANPTEAWSAGWPDQELDYKVERSVYVFFVSALSVLESFAFCLYFVGNATQPSDFSDFDRPRQINIHATGKAFTKAFPRAAISQELSELTKRPQYEEIDGLRNILTHRLSGRRSIRHVGRTRSDGTYTRTHEELWHVPGLGKSLSLTELLPHHLNDLRHLVSALTSAARRFAETKGTT